MRKILITIIILFQFLCSFSQIRNQHIKFSSYKIGEWTGKAIDSVVKVHSFDSLGRKYLKQFDNIINKTDLTKNLTEQYVDINIDTSNYILNHFEDSLFHNFNYSKDKNYKLTWFLSKDNKLFFSKDNDSNIDTVDLKVSYTFYINGKKFPIFKCSNRKSKLEIEFDNDRYIFLSSDFGVLLIYSTSWQTYSRISFANQTDNFYINNLIDYILTKLTD